MKFLISLLDRLYQCFCHHEWIRERRADGELGLQCRRCLKRKEHDLLRIIRWRPQYKPEVWPPDYSAPEQISEADRHAA